MNMLPTKIFSKAIVHIKRGNSSKVNENKLLSHVKNSDLNSKNNKSITNHSL
jgi:hypothetical protein